MVTSMETEPETSAAVTLPAEEQEFHPEAAEKGLEPAPARFLASYWCMAVCMGLVGMQSNMERVQNLGLV